MDYLQSREKAQEDFFAHKQEIELKIRAKTHKYLALWATEQMGISDIKKVIDYYEAVILLDLKQINNNTIIERIFKDLVKAGKKITKYELEDKFNEFNTKSRQELLGND
jgi:hypothetical protein